MSYRRPVVVIDPGHGGNEKIGGSSPNNAAGANGLMEKDLTLDIARRTAAVLQDGVNVLLTRSADVNLSLAERASIARRNSADLFLSIHFNAFKDKKVDGVETFVARKTNPQSEIFAKNVLQNLVKITRSNNRGVRIADLGVIKPERHAPNSAACLVEIGYLTNPAQAEYLRDEAYRQQIAVALGNAIFNSLPKTSRRSNVALGVEDELEAPAYQQLDSVALGGDPVFEIKKSVGKSGDNREDDVYAVKERLIGLGFDWIKLDKKMDSKTIEAIKLFQTIIAGKNSISGDGRIDVGKDTYLWLQTENAPRWQTMPAGSQTEGFFNYELSDQKDTHDFGTNWMANTIRSTAAYYRDNYLKTNSSAALFTVNDVSLAQGGNTPDHAGHEAGLACDLQLPKKDGKAGGITYQDSQYDQNAARAVLKALNAQSNVTTIYFNDPVMTKADLCRTAPGHDNHIHFEIKPPARGVIERKDLMHYRSGGRLYQGSHQDDIDYQTHALDATCNNSVGIKRDEDYFVFAPMSTVSDRPNKKENVYLRWCDIPKNRCEVDVVVHFHGHNITKEKEFFNYTVDISGLELLKPDKTLVRKRPTLCILPFGSPFKREDGHTGYTFPFFAKTDGLQQLIDFGIKELAQLHGLSAGDLKPGRLILTAHSGGGSAVAMILGMSNRKALKLPNDIYGNKKKIDEVHLFDAIYDCDGDEGCQYRPINEWANSKIKADKDRSETDMFFNGGALRVIYNKTANLSRKTLPNSGKLASATLNSFYKVEKTECKHDLIPKEFGPALLEKANAVLDVAKCDQKPKSKAKPAAAVKSLAFDEKWC
jgi:N-acetylmuramoyl-L-alanine amidase